MTETLGSLFVTSNGGITPATFLILLGLPVVFSGRHVWGFLLVMAGLVSAVLEALKDVQELDKQQVRYERLDPDDLIAELESMEEAEDRRTKCLAILATFAQKYSANKGSKEFPLLCQQAGYMTLKFYPEDDEVVAGSISLLALVAKSPHVRQRNAYQADVFGLNHPIQSLQKALERAKQEEEEDKEALLAEIVRKGALYFGALADGDKEFELASKIVEEDGLELILDAANWFRLHEGVANWVLWASFIICYDNTHHKMQFVRLAGVTTVCEVLKNNPSSLEVNRHGIAIMFDLMREGGESTNAKVDPWQVRKMALAAGLHSVLLNAMGEFADSMDIMMMGQEMLIGTGYRGDIPEYKQL